MLTESPEPLPGHLIGPEVQRHLGVEPVGDGLEGKILGCVVGEARGWVLPVSSVVEANSHFEHLLIIIREGAPHKQAKAIFPDGSCRSFQITALLARNKNTRIIPDTPHLPRVSG